MVVAAIAALLLLSGDSSELTPKIAKVLAPLRLQRMAIIEAVRIAMIRPVTSIPDTAKHAYRVTRATEYYYRATYIVQAAQRITIGLRSGQAVNALTNTERSYYQHHLDAQGHRATAALKLDRIGNKQGHTLGWYAVLDSRTSPECREANGKNFEVDRRPPIGYPGMVHPTCRCHAGPPHATRVTVYQIRNMPTQRASA